MTTHTPKLIIHGGAGRAFADPSRAEIVRASLNRALLPVMDELLAGASSLDAVVMGCRLLEDDPIFNAGTGSAIQSDGIVRMSAALMQASKQRSPTFSGVINVEQVRHPIDMAAFLQSDRDRVLAGNGASLLARELNLELHDPIVERRLIEWLRERGLDFAADAVDVVAGAPTPEPEHEHGTGTIGVVALDSSGAIAAGTSTGGRGFERVGRVSDSATPAGNYATEFAGVSSTGIGEDILDACLSARVVVRVSDGFSLHDALEKSMRESQAREHMLGAIAISHDGCIGWAKTSDILLAAYHDGTTYADTIDLPHGTITQVHEG